MVASQLTSQQGMGQQSMNMVQQSSMMSQAGMQQNPVMNPGMGGQQQINTVNMQSHHAASRLPSQSLSQPRPPSISPHTNMGANARTTPLSGQVQMVSPPGQVMHANIGGNMMGASYSRTMGNPAVHGMNYQSGSGTQIATNQTVMTEDPLEKYVTNNE